MSRPEPRPALQRADDGSVHPAAPRVAPEQHLHPVPHAPAVASRPTSTGRALSGTDAVAAIDVPAAEFTGKPVTLSVEIPKDLRKETRRLAERGGTSLDAVVTEALARHVASLQLRETRRLFDERAKRRDRERDAMLLR